MLHESILLFLELIAVRGCRQYCIRLTVLMKKMSVVVLRPLFDHFV